MINTATITNLQAEQVKRGVDTTGETKEVAGDVIPLNAAKQEDSTSQEAAIDSDDVNAEAQAEGSIDSEESTDNAVANSGTDDEVSADEAVDTDSEDASQNEDTEEKDEQPKNVSITVSIADFTKALADINQDYDSETGDKKRTVTLQLSNNMLMLISSGEQSQTIYAYQNEAEGEYQFVVPIGELLQFAASLNRVSSSLSVSDMVLKFTDNKLKVTAGTAKADFDVYDNAYASVPIVEDFSEGTLFSLPTIDFEAAIKKGSVAVFKGNGNADPALIEYLHVTLGEGKMVIGTTDGNKVAVNEYQNDNIKCDERFCIRSKYLKALTFMNVTLNIIIQDNAVIFADGTKFLILRRNDTHYNDIEKLVKDFGYYKEMSNNFVVKKDAFRGALDLSNYQNLKDAVVKLKLNQKSLGVTNEQGDTGSRVDVTVKKRNDKDSHIMSASVHFGALTSFQGLELSVEFDGWQGPLRVNSLDEDEKFTYFINAVDPNARNSSDDEAEGNS